jgi:hypothetical protein
MKKIFALLGLLAFQAFGITNVTLPYLVDTASIPKVRYVDKNDSALKWGVNNLGDTVNAASGTGALVRSTSPTITTPSITGKITGSDSIVATLGLRIGSDTKIYRNGTHMLRMADSLTVDGSVGIGTSTPEFNLDITKSMAGGTVLGVVRNSDNTNTGSHARLGAYVGGPSGGNPLLLLRILGGSDWSVGADNVDADKFKIGPSSSVGTSTALTITTAGAATFSSTVTADSIISSKFYTEGTFTDSISGCTTFPTSTARYVRVGKSVTLYIPSPGTCTSNTTDLFLTTLPPSIVPAHSQTLPIVGGVTDNSTAYEGVAFLVGGANYIQIERKTALAALTTTFTGSGSKGLNLPITITYTLQ